MNVLFIIYIFCGSVLLPVILNFWSRNWGTSPTLTNFTSGRLTSYWNYRLTAGFCQRFLIFLPDVNIFELFKPIPQLNKRVPVKFLVSKCKRHKHFGHELIWLLWSIEWKRQWNNTAVLERLSSELKKNVKTTAYLDKPTPNKPSPFQFCVFLNMHVILLQIMMQIRLLPIKRANNLVQNDPRLKKPCCNLMQHARQRCSWTDPKLTGSI